MISSPSLPSVFFCSSPTHLHPHPYRDLLPHSSLCPISPPPPPPPCPALSSSFPISLSSTPASSRQFQISAKATARRLDAYCCYRNRPSALDYNVTLSPCQGSNVCWFLCLTRCRPAYLLCVWTPVGLSTSDYEVVLLPVCFHLTAALCACYFHVVLLAVTHLNFKIFFVSKCQSLKISSCAKRTLMIYPGKCRITMRQKNDLYIPKAVIRRATCYDWVQSLELNLLNLNLWALSTGWLRQVDIWMWDKHSIMGGDRLQSYSYLLWTPANDFIITEHTLCLCCALGRAHKHADTHTHTSTYTAPLSWPRQSCNHS